MSERKPCIRCERGIDAWAKLCPFCNWDQGRPAPAQPAAVPAEVAQYKPPGEMDLKKYALYGGAGVLLLVVAFLVGMFINQDGAPKNAPETLEEQAAEQKAAGPVKRADTPLVPANEPGGIVEPSITSAPVSAQPGAAPNDWNRTDATAVSATEYAEMARRAKAEKDRMAALVDPRTLTGPAYAQGQRVVRRRPATTLAQNQVPPMPGTNVTPPLPGTAPAPAPMPGASAPPQPAPRRNSIRTRPVPQHQPLPQIYGRGTARLSLLIGPDGRVKSVDIEKPLDRDTAKLIGAIQSWRFKPATENGEPVAAPYSVEITFR